MKLPRSLKARPLRILAALLVLYAAIGFLALPALLRRELPRRLSALLHRPVSLARVRLNPFNLSVTLDGFRILERDGSPFLGWDRLYLNLGARTLFTLKPAFKEIDLEGFHARVVLDAQGRPNFADLLPPAEPGPKGPAAPAPELRIGHFGLVGARIEFLDRATAQPFATTVGPMSLSLDGFRLARDNRNRYAFEGRTERGESFGWRGNFRLDPLRSEGSFHLGSLALAKYAPFYRDTVAFELRQGLADFKADYEASFGGAQDLLKLHKGALDLRNLALGEPGTAEDGVTLPLLEARGLELDLLGSRAELASLALRDGVLRVRRGPDGAVNLQRMLTPRPSPAKEPAKPFQFRLAQFRVQGQTVDILDRVPARAVRLTLDQVKLELDDLSLDPDSSCRMDFDGRWNGRGRMHLAGQVRPLQARGSVALDLRDLDLTPLGGYAAQATAATLASGRLGLRGQLDFDANKPAATRFQGQAQVDGLALVAGPGRDPILSWQSLKLGGLRVAQAPLAVQLASVELDGPQAHFILDAQGHSNLEAAFPPGPAAPVVAAPPGPGPAPAPLALKLDRCRWRGGRAVFLDRSVQPVATLSLEGLEGQVTGLSTQPDSRAELALKALVDGAAPLRVQGRVNLSSQAAYSDLAVTAQGVDLTPLSPYAGRFVGFPILKGKQDLNLRYLVERRQLQAENRVRLDQFTLGEATGSPLAVHLPVKLGLALLRDRQGVIDLDLPVGGNLDQPDFRLGRVIWHAVLNLFGKIAASPFTLLSKAFGGGADLSQVSFTPGEILLGADGEKVTGGLETALFERPGLCVDIEGAAFEAVDGPALRRAALERVLLQGRSEDAPPAPEERAALLRAAYLAAFPPPPGVKAKALPPLPPPAEQEARLLAMQAVDPAELRLLAGKRAQAVRDRLLRGGKVEEARIFLVEGGARASQEPGAKVFFSLK